MLITEQRDPRFTELDALIAAEDATKKRPRRYNQIGYTAERRAEHRRALEEYARKMRESRAAYFVWRRRKLAEIGEAGK